MLGHTVMGEQEYRRGLSTHACGATVLRISGVEILFPSLTRARQKVQVSVAQAGVEPQGLALNDEF